MAHSGAGAPGGCFLRWKPRESFGYVPGAPQNKALEIPGVVSAVFSGTRCHFAFDFSFVGALLKYPVKFYENFVGISPFSGLQLWYQ